jgi:exodeoxyribonuclease V alpha subunit
MSAAVGGPGTTPLSGPLGLLTPFVDAGLIDDFEVQLASTVLRLEPAASEGALLALALAARAPRFGHVCLELDGVADQVDALTADRPEVGPLPWPTPEAWLSDLSASPIVWSPSDPVAARLRPLVRDGRRVYLERFWRYEMEVAGELSDPAPSAPAATGSGPTGAGPLLDGILDRLFGPVPNGGTDLQRLAAGRALTARVSVIAGGPGTGKTHTVARILAAAHLVAAADQRELRAALVAPTGKAAARMGEAVLAQLEAMRAREDVDPATAAMLEATGPMTLHRLLGWRDRTHFRHDRADPLPHDLVIVDETSMVSLPLLAHLMEALRPEARLVLVGDPFQLSSIEAGTVMSDLVGRGGPASGRRSGPLAGQVTELELGHRFGEGTAIAELAARIRAGDADGALDLLDRREGGVRWIDGPVGAGWDDLVDEVATAAVEVAESAAEGRSRAALDAAGRVKVLAATRYGPLGLYEWSDRIGAAVAAAVPARRRTGRPPVGTPVMVTANDPVNHLFNGDVGVVVERDGERWLAMAVGDGVRELAPARLGEWEPWWAMTIHKSQGSEFPHAVVSVPEAGSPILSRELLYTAVTRARDRLTVVGSRSALRAAIDRPVARASGLRDRLWPTGPGTDPTDLSRLT